MATRRSELEARILKLRPAARIRLAERILASVEPPANADHEKLWLAEIERRLDELESGRTRGTPAAVVFRKARSLLR